MTMTTRAATTRAATAMTMARARPRRRRTQAMHRSTTTLVTASAWLLLLSLVLLAQPSQAQVVPITVTPSSSNAPAATASGGSQAPSSISIPSSAANGGITVTDPVQTADASYYKIAPQVSVTFGWNFTSVLSYPTKLVVQAFCSENQNTYTVAASLPGTATSVVWAPYEYDQRAAQSGQPGLIQATYRLQIFDERGLTVAASPGLFAPNTKVQFALYIPQPYTPISGGWFCSACNGAGSLTVPKPLILGIVSTSLVLLLGGLNILTR